MSSRLIGVSAAVTLLAGCATTSQTQWTPTVDTYGSSRAQFLTRDTEECRSLAMRSSGARGEQTASGAVTGGLLGAAGGAAVGAILNSDNQRGARRGAGTGAVVGAMSGGIRNSAETDAAFRRAFNSCMRRRGHNVIG
jgi:hypothetical protein